MLYTIAQTAFFCLYTQLNNMLNIFSMMRLPPVTAFIAANLGLESFVLISAFLGGYKCFQIMEAKGNVLGLLDILKIYARKFVRMAPMYYLLWMFLWSITSRIANGPIWSNTNMAFDTCEENWVYTFFWVGNLAPKMMVPYTGCFEMAWPLQLDL